MIKLNRGLSVWQKKKKKKKRTSHKLSVSYEKGHKRSETKPWIKQWPNQPVWSKTSGKKKHNLKRDYSACFYKTYYCIRLIASLVVPAGYV